MLVNEPTTLSPRPCRPKVRAPGRICNVSLADIVLSCRTVQVTDDITDLTYADVFSAVGKKTDAIARFSIVTASVGRSALKALLLWRLTLLFPEGAEAHMLCTQPFCLNGF